MELVETGYIHVNVLSGCSYSWICVMVSRVMMQKGDVKRSLMCITCMGDVRQVLKIASSGADAVEFCLIG